MKVSQSADHRSLDAKGVSMADAKRNRHDPDKDALDYRAGDMTEGAAAGKMPGVTSKGAAAGPMRAGDMTEGATVGKMPGVTSKGAAAGPMRAGDMTEGAAAGKMPGVDT
jgi:hypothetical protein